nr:conserved Plasmodium protein, unknown function [Plasmodium sp. DRC-Itaito]
MLRRVQDNNNNDNSNNNNNNNNNNNSNNNNNNNNSNNNNNNVSEIMQTNFINFENFKEFENYFMKGDSNIVDIHSNDNIYNNCSLIKKKGNICMYDIFEDNISNMFLMEEEYIEKICLLKNINLNKYIKYKKKKKKKEYIVYLLCERFLLFYMIDYLTLSLDISIKNTFKSIGLLLKYLDIDVYNVFLFITERARSWVVTYYSHVLTEFDKLARIFDTLLSNNETHYIFQNIKWKDINVENIIKKTYYYMNYKIPFDTFLKKIKKKISFPPFSPIYSYPFILHHFDYETKQEELKNRTVEKSIFNFYNYQNREFNNIQNYELKDRFVKDTSVKDISVKDISVKDISVKDTIVDVMGNVTSLNNNNKEIKIKEAYNKNSLNSDNTIRNNVSNDCVNNSDCNSAYYNILREEKCMRT